MLRFWQYYLHMIRFISILVLYFTEMRIKFLYFLFLLAVWLSLPCAVFSQAIKFDYYQGLIYLKVVVNDKDTALFLMDTGANASAIDNTLADKLKLEVTKKDTVEGMAGKMLTEMVVLDKIGIGKAYVNSLSVTKQDLSHMIAPGNKKVSGILGTDVLKHFTITLDFPKHEIVFLKIKLRPNNAGLRYLPFEMDNGIPRIKVTINGTVTTYLRYDSGASLASTSKLYINVPGDIYKKLKAADSTLKPHEYLTATGIGGDLKLPVVTIKTLKNDNGNIDAKNVEMIVQPGQGYFARPDAVGFFSNNLLEKFGHVAIDISSGFMILGSGTL